MQFIDSHVHISEYADPAAVVRFASSCGEILLSSGVDKESSLVTLNIARQSHADLRAFIGIHPSEVLPSTEIEWFDKALEEATGVGEVGLDPKYSDLRRGSAQHGIFIRQLESAEASRKPIQVHSRGAEKVCLEALGSYSLGPVLMHWFQSEAELPTAADRGYYFSFGPALLNSKRLRRMATVLDRSMILVESDGPVQFDSLGGAGGPSLIPSVVFELSRLWGQSFSDTRDLILLNGLSYLGGKT